MRKFILWIFVLLLVVVLTACISLRFFPKLYVSAFNHFSSQQLAVERLDISYFPLSLAAGKLSINNVKGQTLVKVDQVDLSAQVVSWLQGKTSFWQADVANANVKLNLFPGSEQAEDVPKKEAEVTPINVHQILSILNVQIADVRVDIDSTRYLVVNRLNTKVNDENLDDYTKVIQNVDFSVNYVDSAVASDSLFLEGVLQSRYEQGFTVLDLSVGGIDLTSLISETTEKPDLSSQAENAQPSSNQRVAAVVEAPIDWSWMSLIDPLKLDVNIAEVLWSKSNIKAIELGLILDGEIAFTHQSQVTWLESEEFSFDDTIKLVGSWTPTAVNSIGADLSGSTKLSTSNLALNVAGDVNVNGDTGNALSLKLDVAQLPVTTSLDEEVLSLLEQYFPVKVVADIKQEQQTIDLLLQSAQFGGSDLKGAVSLLTKGVGPISIKADLESQLLSYKGVVVDAEEVSIEDRNSVKFVEVAEGESGPTTTVKPIEDDQRLFTEDVIDWTWLDDFLVEFNWTAKKILVNEFEVDDLSIPLSITDGQLDVSDFTAQFGGGSFDVDTTLLKEGGGATLNFELTAKGLVLEKLNLLPPEELKDGVTDITVKLTSSGGSSRLLAQSLNGKINLAIGDGIIGNDSFELIGSDLVLGLINKLNPFAKKNKTTKLECAIVNLDIIDGKVNVDNSIALRTSKLSFVMDGNVDLGSEKIKLRLTPKARQGIGVDVSSLVKFINLGGYLSEPKPVVSASGLLKSAAVVGAAVSTGGVSLLATSALDKTVANVDVCKRASRAFN